MGGVTFSDRNLRCRSLRWCWRGVCRSGSGRSKDSGGSCERVDDGPCARIRKERGPVQHEHVPLGVSLIAEPKTQPW